MLTQNFMFCFFLIWNHFGGDTAVQTARMDDPLVTVSGWIEDPVLELMMDGVSVDCTGEFKSLGWVSWLTIGPSLSGRLTDLKQLGVF